jgi:hypothetical protein
VAYIHVLMPSCWPLTSSHCCHCAILLLSYCASCRWRSVEFGVRRFKELKKVYPHAVAIIHNSILFSLLPRRHLHASAYVPRRWRSVEFGVRRFKDLKEVYILGEVDDVMQVRLDPSYSGVALLCWRCVMCCMQ